MEKRMQMKSLWVILAAMICFWMVPAWSGAAEFTADFVLQPKGEMEIAGKIFVKGDKIRQEMTEEGEKQIMIVRPDKGVTWMITSEEKTYMEIPYESSNKPFEEWSAEKEKSAKLRGEETVSGLACKKYESLEDGETTYSWVSTKYSFPVKVENEEAIMEYRNITESSIPDSQFEVPAGFEKMIIPMLPGGGEEAAPSK